MEKYAFWIAIYGAAISTLLGLLKLIDFRKNRPIIKVIITGTGRAMLDLSPGNSILKRGDGPFVYIRVINVGRRPIAISEAGLLLSKNKQSTYRDYVTYGTVLNEGEQRVFYVEETPLKQKYKLNPDKYVAYAEDNCGKRYYSHNIFQRFINLEAKKDDV